MGPLDTEMTAPRLESIVRSTRARRRCAAWLIGGGLVGLIPAFVWLAPASQLHPPILIAGLWLLALCTVLSEIALKQVVPVQYSSLGGLAVLVLILAGPIPALVTWLLPDLAWHLRARGRRLLTLGLAANVASFGWCVLAGAGVLALTHADRHSPSVAPSVLAVGMTVELVNFSIARGIYGTLHQGYRLSALIRDELRGVLGSELTMLGVTTICVLLIKPLGTSLLAVVAPIVLIPQLLMPALVRARSIAAMSPAAATRCYLRALATQLGVDRRTRRAALAAVELGSGPGQRDRARLPLRLSRDVPFHDAYRAAGYAGERWDGDGRPAGLRGSAIPLESRLLAVARTWSELTARGAHRLPQAEAMLALELESASRLDPQIVRAAGEIVTSEAAFAQLASFQPTLHALPLPRLIRRRVLPRALAAYVPAG